MIPDKLKDVHSYNLEMFKLQFFNGALNKGNRLRILLYKRQQNPSYGTVGNLGNVLSGKDAVIMNP